MLKLLPAFVTDFDAAKRPGVTSEKILGSDISSHIIDNLQEDKDYTISIYAVYPEGPSQPVSTTGKTRKSLDLFLGDVLESDRMPLDLEHQLSTEFHL